MPVNNVITRRYYPALSEVITVDDLPEFLHFAETGLNTLLDKIHYKNLQYSKSQRGDGAFYSLDIVTSNIGIDLPIGLRLILNPDEDGDNTISSFPVSLQYQWEMLAFLRAFKVENFAFTPEAFYDLGLKVFKITDDEVLAHILNYFIEDSDTESKFDLLLDAVNQVSGTNLHLPANEEPSVAGVVKLIRESALISKSISALMFGIFIIGKDEQETKDRLQQFYNRVVPGGIEAYLKALITPKLRATLKLSAGIEFPKSILKPVHADGSPITDENAKTIFKFAEATFYADTESGIGTEVQFAGSLIPELNEIGNTGLIIGFTNAKLDLSKKRNIPEADAAGYGPDFMGLYVQRATIGFSRFGKETAGKTSAALIGENLLIGTGGISGKITLASNGALYRDFGSFAAELNTFSIVFKNGAIVESDIVGQLRIGNLTSQGQPAYIDINAYIKENGDFDITAKPQNGLFPLTLPNVFTLHVRSFHLGRTSHGFYIQVSGKLDFIANIPGLGEVLPKDIEIQKLKIWDNGDIEFEGGSFTISKTFKLKVGPVNLEVSQISLGPYSRNHNGLERRYCFFGFDGVINTGRAGVKATGNGIKYYFTVDNNGTDRLFDSFTSIDGIGIDMTIPGNVSKEKAAFLLEGYLRMSNPDPLILGSNAGSEYTGAVSFSFPKIGLEGSAGMRLKPSIPAFVVDIGLELPGPIPLGATGLGIYGFRGIIGQHYKASKSATTPPLPEEATWWEYYKAKSKITGREGIELDKFADQEGYSVGAGASIATVFDKGFTFSTKLFLYLGLPDVFLMQGQAGILRKRIGINQDVDPPFSALIVIQSKSFNARFGVDYRIPEGGNLDGALFSLKGDLELAFFFNNASGWYLNVGKDQPETQRIRSRILTLFQGYAFLMLSSRGIKAGAGARFDFKIDWRVVKMGLGAFLDLGGSISFKPIQIGGFIQLGGYAYFKILFIKLNIAIKVTLAFEAPHPFSIYGALELNLSLPWPIRKLGNIKFELSWKINQNKAPLLAPIPVISLPDPGTGYLPAAATHILSKETFPINYINQELVGDSIEIPAPGANGWKYNFTDETAAMQVTIPLDSFIDIDLLQPVKPGNYAIGGAAAQLADGYRLLLPPQKGISDQVIHELELAGVDIYTWKPNPSGGGNWVSYHIYEAVTEILKGNEGPDAIDLSKLNNGYWQFNEPNRYNKIRLLSQNMFSYSSTFTDAVSDLDALNYQRKDLFCFESLVKENVISWINDSVGKVYQPGDILYLNGVQAFFANLQATVRYNSDFGHNSWYAEDVEGTVTITFDQPVTYVKLNLGENTNIVRADFAYDEFSIGILSKVVPNEMIRQSVAIAENTLVKELIYDQIDQPISRLYIHILNHRELNFESDLNIGGYFTLPGNLYTNLGLNPVSHLFEAEKMIIFCALYNRAISANELLQGGNINQGKVGQWNLDTYADSAGNHMALTNGSPDQLPAFYQAAENNGFLLHQAYSYVSNNDALIVPYAPELNIETASFSIELTAVFDPFTQGVSTLVSKISTDIQTGNQKGFAIHLVKNQALNPSETYHSLANIPVFDIWFTTYKSAGHSGIKAQAPFTLDCATSKLKEKQYKHILITIDRAGNLATVYIDRIKAATAFLPAELNLDIPTKKLTVINQISYLSESLHRRKTDQGISRNTFIDEVTILNDNLNQVIQPIWRPNTTFAIVIKTKDIVNGNRESAIQQHHVYGFKTAGPVGHFQEKNAIYKALQAADRTAEFKLAGLKYYIDYERSFPDAQSRYDVSKPVFCHIPKVKLFFLNPYMNAMFAHWDAYNGLPAVESHLELQLLDPYGTTLQSALNWEQLDNEVITDANYLNLPPDQQRLYLLNKAASEDTCNVSPLSITKRKKQGTYIFSDLMPNRLYTALFTAVYQPAGEAIQRNEVHRFSFKTSRWLTFADQAASFIFKDAQNKESYAIYPLSVQFSATEINSLLKPLIDKNTENDPARVSRFTNGYDRIVYGGLGVKNQEPLQHSVIQIVISHDPGDNSNKRILGIIISNPEPFNNPKLTSELLADTIGLRIVSNGKVTSKNDFLYFHSTDTSAVFITNVNMDIPEGTMTIYFKEKRFNGIDYTSDFAEYTTPDLILKK